MFSCIENYYKIDLDSHLKRWQEFSHDFEGRVIFTRIRYKMRVLIHWWLSNCHKLSCTLQSGTCSDQWSYFSSRLGRAILLALSLICYCFWYIWHFYFAELLWIKYYFSYYVFPWQKVKFLEAGCHIFLIYLVYCFFRFDIPSISLDILCILFQVPISLSEKPGITIINALYLVICTKNLV